MHNLAIVTMYNLAVVTIHNLAIVTIHNLANSHHAYITIHVWPGTLSGVYTPCKVAK